MQISEYADCINANLRLLRHSCQDNRWTALFEDCDIQDDGALIRVYGNGKTPHEAIIAYVQRIKGQKIVFYAMSKTQRREFIVPKDLEVDDE